MGGYKRSLIDTASRYLPVFKYRRTSGWGLNSGYKRSYANRRKFSTFRRRYKTRFNVKKLRSRRRTRATKKTITAIFRQQIVLPKPNATGEITYCTYASLNNFKENANYGKLFDEYKVLKVYHKFRVEKSAKVENDQDDVDIIHWSCYDPDADARTFKGLTDFQKCANSKWHIVKPYQVRTSVLTPVFQKDQITDTGVKSVNNPWRNIENTSATFSSNGIQHYWKGPFDATDPGAKPQYKIICEQSVKVIYRGLRQGQNYK